MSESITFDDFLKVDIRVGRIVSIEEFPKARKPAYKVQVDFGAEMGMKWSSAQVTHYAPEELIGRQVIAVVNFAPKNIAGFLSEILILGVPDNEDRVALVKPDPEVPLGGRLY